MTKTKCSQNTLFIHLGIQVDYILVSLVGRKGDVIAQK